MEKPLSGLIESTLRNLTEHLRNLEAERARIDQKISEVKIAIQKWEAELRNGEQSKSSEDMQHARRRRGENFRILRELFESTPGLALTTQEAVERTGLPHSSAQVVFTKEGSGWQKGNDNRWRLIQNENSPLSS